MPPISNNTEVLRFDAIDPHRTALLVVDMQNFFLHPAYPLAIPEMRIIIPNIQRVIAAARLSGMAVIWTRHTFSSVAPYALPVWEVEGRAERTALVREHLSPGTHSHEIWPDLQPTSEELVLNKHRFSAFLPNSSDLHVLLTQAGHNCVVITGVLSNICCESTARDAMMLDYKVVFLSDATAARTQQEHGATLLNLERNFADVRTTASYLAMTFSGS